MLIGALVLGFGASATMAAWTDDEFASTEITAGTFSIMSRTAASPTFAAHETSETAVQLPLNATNLYPGQSRAAWLQIQTMGTVPGTVQLTAVTPTVPVEQSPHTDLRGTLTVRIAATTATTTADPTCSASTPASDDVPIGSLPALAAQSLEPNGANVVNYCVIVSLPESAPVVAQGGTVTPVWTFTATTD